MKNGVHSIQSESCMNAESAWKACLRIHYELCRIAKTDTFAELNEHTYLQNCKIAHLYEQTDMQTCMNTYFVEFCEQADRQNCMNKHMCRAERTNTFA